MSGAKFMNTCSFIIHFKVISLYSRVFVKCITCLGQLEEASSSSFSSFQSAPLTYEVYLDIEKLKRPRVESFQHF